MLHRSGGTSCNWGDTRTIFEQADVALVSRSYERIAPRSAALAVSFFTRLHETQPRLRRFFPFDDVDARAVAKELFELVVVQLRSGAQVSWLLERMGRRGLIEGIGAGDVNGIGVCLVAALAEFDASWTTETARAWTNVYEWASAAVRRGAETRRALR